MPFLMNARFQWPCACGFTPYIGGGAGFSVSLLDADHIVINDISMDGTGSDTVFAYQAFAGMRYRINDKMGISVEYRYFATESPSFKADVAVGTDTDRVRFGGASSHAVSIAFELKF
jgi:opacity protein-like surface antigen